MLFDSHAHLDDRAFDLDRSELIRTLPERGIGLLMDPGCSLASSYAAGALAEETPWIYAAAGSHPDAADEVDEETLDAYRTLIRGNRKVKAVGEIGLDYHYEDVPREIQKAAFRAQLDLAAELDMPVIVHEREAHQDALEILDDYPGLRGVFHCFSGSKEMALDLVRRGWYVGFTGVLTFKNARRAIEAASAVPLDRILIETDCPYMAPEPFRGKRNDPGYVYRVAEALARIKGISVAAAADATYRNACTLYGIREE